jgi:coenzyme PQQ precursor peptide PqqA
MWTKPASTEMRFGFEVTMYVMNKYFLTGIYKVSLGSLFVCLNKFLDNS